jgi:hypothetical protein
MCPYYDRLTILQQVGAIESRKYRLARCCGEAIREDRARSLGRRVPAAITKPLLRGMIGVAEEAVGGWSFSPGTRSSSWSLAVAIRASAPTWGSVVADRLNRLRTEVESGPGGFVAMDDFTGLQNSNRTSHPARENRASDGWERRSAVTEPRGGITRPALAHQFVG